MRSSLFSPLCKCVGILMLILSVASCGGSGGGNSDYSYAYLQFYNASPNGATVTVLDEDGDELGSAKFGDTTSLISLENGKQDFEFVYTDSDDQEVTIDTFEIRMRTGYKTLVVLGGDFENPEFYTYEMKREDLDDHFRLFATSFMTDGESFDVYLSEDGDPFEAANFLGTVTYSELVEFEYWDPDSDSDDFDEGEYTLYLTEPGSTDVVFESDTIDFAYNTEYVLAARDVTGALQSGMAVDFILNSSTVTSAVDVEATSQYRIYNSLNSDSPVTVTLTGDSSSEAVTYELSAGELSDFTEIEYGDYNLSLSIGDGSLTPLTNKLVTLNQSESKAIIIYENEGGLVSLSFVESAESQAYDKTVNFINLVPDYSDVDFYLVRSDETTENAEYSVQNVELGEVEEESLPEDYYEVIAVHEDINDEQTLLHRTDSTGFNETANYFITVEPTETGNGYEIVINK